MPMSTASNYIRHIDDRMEHYHHIKDDMIPAAIAV